MVAGTAACNHPVARDVTGLASEHPRGDIHVIRPLAALLALTFVAGCSSAAPSSSTLRAPRAPPPSRPGSDGIALAAVSLPRLATTSDDAAKAGDAVNAFGLDLYAKLVAADPQANLVVSPASIQVALAMARAGAKGTTAAEMDAVMHGLGADANAAWVAALDQSLNGKTATFKDALNEDQEVVLRSVNAPFAQQGYPLEDAYLAALAERFGAGLRLVDYIGDPEGSRGVINRWVKDQTEDRIPELLAAGTVDADHAARARQRHLPQGGLGLPVRRGRRPPRHRSRGWTARRWMSR